MIMICRQSPVEVDAVKNRSIQGSKAEETEGRRKEGNKEKRSREKERL